MNLSFPDVTPSAFLNLIRKGDARDLHEAMAGAPWLEHIPAFGLKRSLIRESFREAAHNRSLYAIAGLLGSFFLLDQGYAGVGPAMLIGTAAITWFVWAKPMLAERDAVAGIEELMLSRLANWAQYAGVAHLAEFSPGAIMAELDLREDLWTYNRSLYRSADEMSRCIDPNRIDECNAAAGWFKAPDPDAIPDIEDFEKRLKAARLKLEGA